MMTKDQKAFLANKYQGNVDDLFTTPVEDVEKNARIKYILAIIASIIIGLFLALLMSSGGKKQKQTSSTEGKQ